MTIEMFAFALVAGIVLLLLRLVSRRHRPGQGGRAASASGAASPVYFGSDGGHCGGEGGGCDGGGGGD